ncbi:AAA family ATPase [Desulfobacula sp.]|uniref:ExeA family protein n=1 Tax=Desulfobacula sp. TaxID=2593537 RepID=UPI0026019819|nr:AAA family ATPase [Desulfobacula sp.]
MINNGESPAEFFDYKYHPFADTYRLKTPYLGEQDNRFFKTAQSLISTGKSFALSGPSGAGKSTLVHYVLSRLDANCYRPALVHYGGLQRNGMLKAIADVLGVVTSGRTVPLLIKLQKQIMQMASENHSMFPVFVMDDAHLMEKESLMDICSLMFNPHRETVAASFILVGDETFEKKLSLQIMAPVRTRLTGQFNLNTLNDTDSLEFIKFRLSNAKAPETLFDPDALSIMSSHCRGNRRQIMNMGTLLLAEAFYRQEKTISAELIYNCDQIEISE